MALRRQSLSPTAHLLRNSRLFSLPNPLPRPVVGETSGAGVTKASDSATLPYPTHQAIATTRSSLARGDWGLKRNLPARSRLLQTSDPVLRVTQLDTIEHVTDFDSAADHVRTRQKWEQLGAPLMKGMQHMQRRDMTGAPPVSAFEARDDTTAYDAATGLDESGLFLNALKANKRQREAAARRTRTPQPFTPFKPPPVDADVHNTRRWKHDGPWLPGQSAAEFVAYLSREIAKHRPEFNAYLIEFVKNELYTTRQLAAARSGDLPPIDPADAHAWQAAREQQWATITDDDITAGIKTLRRETASDPIGSKLVQKLIVPFLRLPTIRFKYRTYSEDASTKDFEKYVFDQETAPLSTHPSAGLGYLRTKAYLATHPILGPQQRTLPTPARVIQPRQTSNSKEYHARLGIAGFVTNDQYRVDETRSGSKSALNNTRDVETIDLDTPGGKKLLVHPLFAAVSNDGRVHVKVVRASGAENAVARGELEDRPPPRTAQRQMEPLFGRRGRNGGSERSGLNGFARRGERSAPRERSALDDLAELSGSSTAAGAAGAADAAAPAVLDEQSVQGKQFAEFIQSPNPRRGVPGPGFPGVKEGLRGE